MVHIRLFRQFFTFLFLLILALSLSRSTNAAHLTEPIQILPNVPTFSQPFVVVVSGRWANSCVPVFQQMGADGMMVWIEAKTPGPLVICDDKPTDWSFPVLVQPLPPNEYRLDVSIISGITNIPTFYAGTFFEVQGGIDISPTFPTPDDAITIRLADLHPDGCVPRYLSHTVTAAGVTVEAQTPDGVCGQVPTPWEIDVEIDPLTANDYAIELWVTAQGQDPPQRRLYASQSFAVYDRVYRIHLPQVDNFGMAARRGVRP